jgi:hypothetical protein
MQSSFDRHCRKRTEEGTHPFYFNSAVRMVAAA